MPRIAWKHRVLAVVLATALVAICAHIAMPLGFTPIPVTMQTFAVLLLGLLFSPGAAFACLALYLVEGALGLPVFSPHGPGGMAQLLGPSGGYLLSYPLAAALASLLYRRGQRRLLAAFAAAGLASILILAAGATWLGLLSHCEFSACLRPIDRTVPSWRCRQSGGRERLRRHAWIIRRCFTPSNSLRSLPVAVLTALRLYSCRCSQKGFCDHYSYFASARCPSQRSQDDAGGGQGDLHRSQSGFR